MQTRQQFVWLSILPDDICWCFAPNPLCTQKSLLWLRVLQTLKADRCTLCQVHTVSGASARLVKVMK